MNRQLVIFAAILLALVPSAAAQTQTTATSVTRKRGRYLKVAVEDLKDMYGNFG